MINPDELPFWFAIAAPIFLLGTLAVSMRRDVIRRRRLEHQLETLEKD